MKRTSKIIVLFIVLVSLFGCSKKTKDPISNNSWQAGDGSVIIFNKDGTYYWYRDIEVKDDYYYYGKYKIYRGEAAIEFVDSLTQYGVTKKEQEDYIARLDGVELEDYYCVELTIESFIMDYQENATNPWTNYFIGVHYEKENVLDFLNMNAASYATFKLYEE